MKIGGVNIPKKVIIIVVVLLIIVFACKAANKSKAEKQAQLEAQQREQEIQEMANQENQVADAYESYDYHSAIQESLVQEYGEPPEGFEWDMMGNLIALSDDTSKAEDVMYYYLRSLSVLDFSTAQRYSLNSTIIEGYQSYYSDIANQLSGYYSNFLRKQYKFSLTSLEVIEVKDVAVFADGTEYITVNIACLDLTDKDFWEEDRQEIFETMRVYEETETDSTKANQYLYDYIYSKYEDGTIGKKTYTIELVLTKNNGSGWLVTGDGELRNYLEYTNGVDVAEYIMNEYQEWYRDITLQESLLEMQNQNNDGVKDHEDYDYTE